MTRSVRRDLERLSELKAEFNEGAAAEKLALLDRAGPGRLPDPAAVRKLHESLCFMRAYPDDVALLGRIEELLGRFGGRADVRRFRRELLNSGIAGTVIEYPFFWFTAKWLADRWGDRLSVDWKGFDAAGRLESLLHLLVPYTETPALDEIALSAREWVAALKGPDETDAAFLIRRFAALRADSFGRETLYEDLDIPVRIEPGLRTPARTHEKCGDVPVVFQKTPLDRSRPDLRRAVRQPPASIKPVPPQTAQSLIDLARGAMVARSRDLDVFVHADPNDVRLVDCGGGLQFACFGARPERRLMLEAVYGFLTLKNGVPIGYVLSSALFRSAGVAYNVFETFRGGESAYVYGRILAMVRHLFGCDAFSVDPYQLGHENDEALRSGAWWFYLKLGFRPAGAEVRRIMRGELKKMKSDRGYRSPIPVLKKLVAEHVYYYMNPPRRDVLGLIGLGNIGMKASRYLAERFGSDREKGIRTCAREAARLLGSVSIARLSAGERLAWERWSPLVLAIPGVDRWSLASRKALARVVLAKGGRRESDFVLLFDRHALLKRALAKMAAEDAP